MSSNEELNKRIELEKALISQAWSNPAFKEQLISNPRQVFSQILGSEIPDTLDINVVEESGNSFTLVIPPTPEEEQASEELTDEALEAVAGGDWVITKNSKQFMDRLSTLNTSDLNLRITNIGRGGFGGGF